MGLTDEQRTAILREEPTMTNENNDFILDLATRGGDWQSGCMAGERRRLLLSVRRELAKTATWEGAPVAKIEALRGLVDGEDRLAEEAALENMLCCIMDAGSIDEGARAALRRATGAGEDVALTVAAIERVYALKDAMRSTDSAFGLLGLFGTPDDE